MILYTVESITLSLMLQPLNGNKKWKDKNTFLMKPMTCKNCQYVSVVLFIPVLVIIYLYPPKDIFVLLRLFSKLNITAILVLVLDKSHNHFPSENRP